MDFLAGLAANLSFGFQHALTASNLFYCLIGTALGTAIGVLPGLGPVATIAMLLPITFGLPPVSALIMLAGIYYGAQYGGSTTAILINLPGESSSVVTAIDGYQMAQQGQGGQALFAAAVSSFVAGTIATLLIAALGPVLGSAARAFEPADYFALMVLGLAASVALAHGPLLKALAMVVLGLLLGTVGRDLYTGAPRFTFGFLELADGLDFVALAMGMFGLAEVVRNLEDEQKPSVVVSRLRDIVPTREQIRAMVRPTLRGTALGSVLGILPGGGAILASFGAYVCEKRLAKDPSRFGKGAIEGVAGPEAANNAGAQTSFIPMLTLGIPSNPVMALMIGAMIIQGITPGPTIMSDNPELFWGVVASMWVGNLMLLTLNLPLIGVWVKLLSVPYRVLFPAIVAMCCIGVYSVSNNTTDVYAMAAFCVIGYALIKFGCEPAPLLLGFVIGRLLEEYLRRAMLIAHGDLLVFVERPISGTLLLLALLTLAIVLVPTVGSKRTTVFREEAN
jgi:putative tricarboxylic transport membrane protein